MTPQEIIPVPAVGNGNAAASKHPSEVADVDADDDVADPKQQQELQQPAQQQTKRAFSEAGGDEGEFINGDTEPTPSGKKRGKYVTYKKYYNERQQIYPWLEEPDPRDIILARQLLSSDRMPWEGNIRKSWEVLVATMKLYHPMLFGDNYSGRKAQARCMELIQYANRFNKEASLRGDTMDYGETLRLWTKVSDRHQRFQDQKQVGPYPSSQHATPTQIKPAATTPASAMRTTAINYADVPQRQPHATAILPAAPRPATKMPAPKMSRTRHASPNYAAAKPSSDATSPYAIKDDDAEFDRDRPRTSSIDANTVSALTDALDDMKKAFQNHKEETDRRWEERKESEDRRFQIQEKQIEITSNMAKSMTKTIEQQQHLLNLLIEQQQEQKQKSLSI